MFGILPLAVGDGFRVTLMILNSAYRLRGDWCTNGWLNIVFISKRGILFLSTKSKFNGGDSMLLQYSDGPLAYVYSTRNIINK